jgi:ABC-type ATPase with predicted acetyltransferase domain
MSEHIPAWNASPPFGAKKVDLVAWLVSGHGIAVYSDMTMAEITSVVEARYGLGVPHEGERAAVWEVWAFVVKEEKALRGGQRRLL